MDLLETKLLDVKRDMNLGLSDETINPEKISIENNMISFKICETETKEKNKIPPRKCLVNCYDAGGHSEYETLSSLLLTDNTIFNIVFRADQFSEDRYQPMIGSYMDMLSEKCPTESSPIIMLTASQVDRIDEVELTQQIAFVESMATTHVEEINARSSVQVNLVKDVIATSAKTFKNVDLVTSRLRSIIDCEQLMRIRRSIPVKWKRFLELLDKPTVTKEKAVKIWENMPTLDDALKGELSNDFKNQLIQTSSILRCYIDETLDNIDFTPEENEGYKDYKDSENEDLENIDPKYEDNIQADPVMKKREILDKNNRPADSKKAPSKETIEMVDLILRHAENMGDTISFPMISDPELKNTIFTDVMATIESLRVIVRHDIPKVFSQAKPAKKEHDNMAKVIVNTGIVTCEALSFLVEQSLVNETIGLEKIKEILVGLKVAFPMGESGLFIPCLISDRKRDKFIKEGYMISGKENIEQNLTIQYCLQNHRKSRNLYEMLLIKLADTTSKDKHVIAFNQAFSQKRENRTLGLVSASEGNFGWQRKNGESVTINFKMLEEETKKNKDSEPFAVFRILSMVINKNEGVVDSTSWDIVNWIDEIVTDLLEKNSITENEFERRILCNLCLEDQYRSLLSVDRTSESLSPGYFMKSNGFLEPIRRESCQFFKSTEDLAGHSRGNFEQKNRTVMIEPDTCRDFNYTAFLKDGIKEIAKKKFKDLKTELQPGDQVWIYRENIISSLWQT